MITLYGIPNCDTVKKARAFLEKSGVPYRFHDYKKDGVDLALLKRCCNDFGYESVLNQRGTACWRMALNSAVNTWFTGTLSTAPPGASWMKCSAAI